MKTLKMDQITHILVFFHKKLQQHAPIVLSILFHLKKYKSTISLPLNTSFTKTTSGHTLRKIIRLFLIKKL